MTAPTGRPRGRPKKVEAVTPATLTDALKNAKTAKSLDTAARALSVAILDGSVDRFRAKEALAVLKERRQLLRARRDERAVAQVRALEILTPDEAEMIRAHRAKLAGPPMKPGEKAPPPVTTKAAEPVEGKAP